MHLDHGDEDACYDCIESGFYSSVMIDASHFPFEENVAITKRVVERAHTRGINVEAELGQLGGVEEDISVDEEHVHLTDPQQAAEFAHPLLAFRPPRVVCRIDQTALDLTVTDH